MGFPDVMYPLAGILSVALPAHPINLGELWAHLRNIGDCLTRARTAKLFIPNAPKGITGPDRQHARTVACLWDRIL